MDDKRKDEQGPVQGAGYETPGDEAILQSSSDVVPSPTQTGEERLTNPKPYISSIDQVPGDANPALVETVGAERGDLSTAEMLRTREAAEEQRLRAGNAEIYADQPPGAQPQEGHQVDAGRSNSPNDQTESPMEQLDAPNPFHAYMGGADVVDPIAFEARADAVLDSARDRASAGEARSGLSEISDSVRDSGFNYEEREMDRPAPQGDFDTLGVNAPHVPPRSEE